MIHRFYIEIEGEADSYKLYKMLEKDKINMVAAQGKIWIYGECGHSALGRIVQACAGFGKLNATIEGGGMDGQKEKQESSG